MNERIRKLVKQAELPLLDVDGKCKYGDTYFSTEKFAELIVRECITIINHGIDHTDYPHPNDTEKSMIEMKAQMWCRDAIKEHFGLDKQTK